MTMLTSTTSTNAATSAASTTTTRRTSRDLPPAERRIKMWIDNNYGVLSRVARQTGVSVAFVQRVAYNREARSKNFKVEKKLLGLGCPLIQKIR